MIRKNVFTRCVILLTSSILLFSGCGSEEKATTEVQQQMENSDNEMVEASYTMITMDEAKAIFEESGDYIILDVRTAQEFADGHIPGSINIPNETIGSDEIDDLPNKDQQIYVYCRSGNRSKQASEKLVNLGYTNIIECGGIIDWAGEVEK